MSAVVPYTSFRRETWEVAKCRLFSLVFPYVAVPFLERNLKITLKLFLDNYTRPQRQFVILSDLGSLSLDKRSKPDFPFGYHIIFPNLFLLNLLNIYFQGCLVPVLFSFINRWWRQSVVKAKERKTSPGRVLMFRQLDLDFTLFLVVNWNNPAYKFSKPLAMLEKHFKKVSRDVSVL